MGFLEVVGAITVFVAGCAATAVVYGCAREAHRAFVQVCRKARIRYGRGWSKKMGLHGVYHHASEKHLHRYVGEFTFRLNEGDVKRHTMDRLASLLAASFGPRLTYQALTA